jgi:hypothetical protein
MAGKKIKLDTEAISEFLVADTNSESCSKARDFEVYFEEEEKSFHDDNNNSSSSRPQQTSKHRLR